MRCVQCASYIDPLYLLPSLIIMWTNSFRDLYLFFRKFCSDFVVRFAKLCRFLSKNQPFSGRFCKLSLLCGLEQSKHRGNINVDYCFGSCCSNQLIRSLIFECLFLYKKKHRFRCIDRPFFWWLIKKETFLNSHQRDTGFRHNWGIWSNFLLYLSN